MKIIPMARWWMYTKTKIFLTSLQILQRYCKFVLNTLSMPGHTHQYVYLYQKSTLSVTSFLRIYRLTFLGTLGMTGLAQQN